MRIKLGLWFIYGSGVNIKQNVNRNKLTHQTCTYVLPELCAYAQMTDDRHTIGHRTDEHCNILNNWSNFTLI